MLAAPSFFKVILLSEPSPQEWRTIRKPFRVPLDRLTHIDNMVRGRLAVDPIGGDGLIHLGCGDFLDGGPDVRVEVRPEERAGGRRRREEATGSVHATNALAVFISSCAYFWVGGSLEVEQAVNSRGHSASRFAIHKQNQTK